MRNKQASFSCSMWSALCHDTHPYQSVLSQVSYFFSNHDNFSTSLGIHYSNPLTTLKVLQECYQTFLDIWSSDNQDAGKGHLDPCVLKLFIPLFIVLWLLGRFSRIRDTVHLKDNYKVEWNLRDKMASQLPLLILGVHRELLPNNFYLPPLP